jgi:methylthioxylose transferase
MRLIRFTVLGVIAALVAGLAVALRGRLVPLGVPGEWLWDWQRFGSVLLDVVLAVVCLFVYATFAALGWRALARGDGARQEAAWVACLVVASVAVQVIVISGAPVGYGLAKWATVLQNSGASGYYTVARNEIRDPWRFLTDYPTWIQQQVVPRIGGHPPGLFLLTRGLLDLFEAEPGLAERVLNAMPETVRLSFDVIDRLEPISAGDRAALGLLGALTLFFSAATVLPLYLLARTCLPPCWAWSTAVLWPLMPSALLFQPSADTAFPFLSTSALALVCWAIRGQKLSALLLAFGAGLLLTLGMLFTLAFLPFGVTVALVLASAPGLTWRWRRALFTATGASFLGVSAAAWAISGVNPFFIWELNWIKHAQFYVFFPKSYVLWVLVNPIEMLVGLGLPVTVWGMFGVSLRRTPRFFWACLAVLAVLSFGGWTLAEVSRLWLPWLPALLVAAAMGMERKGGGPWTLAATLLLLGAQAMVMQAYIQVAYPAVIHPR